MALTKISTAMISQSAAAVDLNVDAGTFYVDATNNRVGVGGKTDPDTPLHVVGTVTATLFAGSGASLTSIPNSALTNSSITINSTATSLGGSITLGTDDVAEGSSNLYYTNARADARIAAASTSDLSEGTNLYYTDARVDARVSGGSLGNITTTGYIRGPATFTLDPAAHGDNTGTVVIAGNLQVDGTTTTINSTTMTVDDKNITLASGSANAAAASGAGFTVDIGTGTNPAITYDGTNDEWDFNKDINVTGTISSGAISTSAVSTFSGGNTDYAAIFSSADAYSGIRFQDPDGSGTVYYRGAADHLYLHSSKFSVAGSTLASGYQFQVNGSANLTGSLAIAGTQVISSTGNLTNIGTISSGAITSSGSITATNTILNTGSTTVSAILRGGDANSKNLVFQKTTGSAQQAKISAVGDDLRFTTGPTTERMRINSSGKVGIGDPNPAELLTVKDGNIKLQSNSNGNTGILVLYDAAGTQSGQVYPHTGDLRIWSPNDVLLLPTGNVGIGTSSPTQKLTVLAPNNNGIQIESPTIAKGYLFFGDPDSNTVGRIGYDHATNEFDFWTNSSQAMLIDASGNVGIGTDDPSAPLTVQSNTGGGTINLVGRASDGYSTLAFRNNADNSTLAALFADESSDDLQIHVAGSERMRIKSDGNVQIGTAAVTGGRYFDIYNTGSTATDFAITRLITQQVGSSSTTSADIYKRKNGEFGFTNNDTNSAAYINFKIGASNVMRLKSNGNVGIGTSAPYTKLEVKGANQTFTAHFGQGTNNSSGDWGGISLGYSENNNSYRKVGIAAKAVGDGAARQELHFLVDSVNDGNNADINDSKMVIDIDGNVGIGTSAPGSVLHVKGGTTTTQSTFSNFISNSTFRSVVNHANEYGLYMGYSNSTTDVSAIQSGRSNGTVDKLALNPYGGSVGIGTTSPAQALEVEGNIRINHEDIGGSPAMTAQLQLYGYDGRGVGVKLRDQQNSASNSSSREWFVGTGYAQSNFNIGYSATGSQSSYAANNKLTITTDGKVGIGTNNPSGFFADSYLVLGNGTGTPTSTIYGSSSGTSYLLFADGTTGSQAYAGGLEYNHASDFLGFFANGSEAARFDSSGNLLVGKTANNTFNEGFVAKAAGGANITSAGNTALDLNRRTNNGTILNFRKDNATVGSIRSISGDSIAIGTGDAGLRFISGTNRIQPVDMDNGLNSDGLTSLGDTNKRFKDLYLSGGIHLGGAGNANKLDDYEEGTWTPSLRFNGSNTGMNGSSFSGKYTKIGNIVHATLYIQLTNKGTSTGDTDIYGLPFTSINQTAGRSSGVVGYFNSTVPPTNFGDFLPLIESNETRMAFRYYNTSSGDSSTITNAHFSNNTTLFMSITYMTA